MAITISYVEDGYVEDDYIEKFTFSEARTVRVSDGNRIVNINADNRSIPVSHLSRVVNVATAVRILEA